MDHFLNSWFFFTSIFLDPGTLELEMDGLNFRKILLPNLICILQLRSIYSLVHLVHLLAWLASWLVGEWHMGFFKAVMQFESNYIDCQAFVCSCITSSRFHSQSRNSGLNFQED